MEIRRKASVRVEFRASDDDDRSKCGLGFHNEMVYYGQVVERAMADFWGRGAAWGSVKPSQLVAWSAGSLLEEDPALFQGALPRRSRCSVGCGYGGKAGVTLAWWAASLE